MKNYNQTKIKFSRYLRNKMTPHERKLWYCFLKGYQPKFKRQQVIGNYIVDFYCPNARVVLELDGGGHYEVYGQTEADMERDKKLQEMGFNIIRIPNSEIDNSFKEMCNYIDEEIKKRI